MTDNELAELLKTSSPKTLYIVNEKGELKAMKCPFRVIVLINVAKLEKGQSVMVDEIKVTYELITVYSINGDLYYYYYFDLIAK
jgi:hypothetical protein